MTSRKDALKLSEPVELAYMNATDRIIVNIARHLKSGRAIHTAKWETQKLSEMGQLTAENARIIRDALRQMPKDVRNALDVTAQESLALVDEALEEAIKTGAVAKPPISSESAIVDQLSQQALDQFNLVNTTMLESSQKAYLKVVNDTVMWENTMLSEAQEKAALGVLNDATMAVLSGGETRNLALRRAIMELNNAGLYGFVDKRGRHWSPEAYVNMCMRTTTHRVETESVKQRGMEYGSSIFQVSYHPASRPTHYPFQNKFYSWDGTSGTFVDGAGHKHKYESAAVTGYGTAAGLFGINCGHHAFAQVPGVTVPADPDTQPAEKDAEDYYNLQKQREIERKIRFNKRLAEAYRAAGDDMGAALAEDKVRMAQKQMREFLDETGLPRRYNREQISGYGPDKLVRPKQKPAPKKTSKKVTPPAPVGPMKVENYPDAFTSKAAEKKNTKTLVDFVNSKAGTADPTVLELYSTIGKQHALPQNQFSFKISHAADHAFGYTYNYAGKLVRTSLTVPKLTEPDIIGKINTTLHEHMHMIDMYLRVAQDSHYAASAFGTPVISRFDKLVNKGTPNIGEKTKKLFDDFNKAYEVLEKERQDRVKEVTEEVTRKYYPDGHVDVFADFRKWEQFKKERNKATNQVYDDYNWKKRAVLGGGIDDLQDIYDALSGGKFRETGVVKYGHGSRYFSSEENRKSEIVANYGALSITRPDLIEVLKEEQPELVGVLDELMKELAAKVV